MHAFGILAWLVVAAFATSSRGSVPGDESWDPRFGPRGLNSAGNALASDGNNLYAGGSFTTTADGLANRIASWDGSTWSALGSGTDGAVRALAWDGSNLYAGGSFATAGGVPANNIAKWDGTSWSALSTGTNGAPFPLCGMGATCTRAARSLSPEAYRRRTSRGGTARAGAR